MSKKQSLKKKQRTKDFMPNPFDPLGMYGSTPQLDVLDDEPTQDSDDL